MELQKYFGFLELMKKSLCLKQPEHIVIQLHSLKVETISALNVKISLEALNCIWSNILPDDGKRKKAVVQQTHFHAPMKRRL